jgi:heme/copper-type cytochrome/quinol oxidase subunit 2
VTVGETVTLAVSSDAADEVHVHGYDVTAKVAAGRPATLTFPADVPGVFEVELHEAGTMLLSLQVG